MSRDPWRAVGEHGAPGPGDVALGMVAGVEQPVLVREVRPGRGSFLVSLRRNDGEWSRDTRRMYRLRPQ